MTRRAQARLVAFSIFRLVKQIGRLCKADDAPHRLPPPTQHALLAEIRDMAKPRA